MSLPVFPNLKSQAWNSTKTQQWDTTVKISGSGKRKTMTTRAYPKWLIECSYTALTHKEITQIAGFLGTVKGQLKPFLWLDMEDYRQAGINIGTGDGIKQRFQLLRSWPGFVEPVLDIVPNTLIIYQGSNIFKDFILEDNGIIYFPIPPPAGIKLTADFKYYWRVSLEEDDLTWEIFWYNFYKLNSFKVVTV